MKRNLIATLGALTAGLIVSSSVATAGSVAWNVSVGGFAGNVGFGVGVASAPAFPPPPPAIVAPPCVVVAPAPVWVVPAPAPYVVDPRQYHWRHRPGMLRPPAPVYMAAPPCIAGPVFVNRPVVFAQPPVFRAGR